MKAALLVMLVFLLGKGCNDETKNDIKTAVIEYKANTRGYYQKIVVKDQKVYISKDRNKDSKDGTKISDADWKELIVLFQEIDLEGIPDLKAPTEKRFYDGAAMADLDITYKEIEYKSQTFDHGNPPAEIEKLVNKIVSLAKEKEEE